MFWPGREECPPLLFSAATSAVCARTAWRESDRGEEGQATEPVKTALTTKVRIPSSASCTLRQHQPSWIARANRRSIAYLMYSYPVVHFVSLLLLLLAVLALLLVLCCYTYEVENRNRKVLVSLLPDYCAACC